MRMIGAKSERTVERGWSIVQKMFQKRPPLLVIQFKFFAFGTDFLDLCSATFSRSGLSSLTTRTVHFTLGNSTLFANERYFDCAHFDTNMGFQHGV